MYDCGANEIRNRNGIRIVISEDSSVQFYSGVGNGFFLPASAGDNASAYNIPDNWDGEIGCEYLGDINSSTKMFSRNSYGIAFGENYV
jgi:hypothetical protein